MTLKEFYAAVGGDYDATLNRIPKESMEMYALSDFLIMVFVMVSEAVT